MVWFICIFLLYFLFDVNYFLRGWIMIPFYFIKSKLFIKDLFEESTQHGVCFTTDLDLNLHMNNARYLRECDFSRAHFLIEHNFHPAMRKIKARVMNAGNNIRYRRSLQLFDVYKMKTKVLCWDEKAFYLEQQVVRNRDDFICAVNICKMCVIGSTPQKLFETVKNNVKSPEPSIELQRLLESWQLSSERLRKSS